MQLSKYEYLHDILYVYKENVIMSNLDQLDEISFSLPPEYRQDLTDRILASCEPISTSLISTDIPHTENTKISAAVFPQAHLAELLQIQRGINPHQYDGWGDPNEPHSNIASIVWSVDMSYGFQMALYEMLHVQKFPNHIREQLDQWQGHLSQYYRVQEAGMWIEMPHGRQIIGFQGFGNKLDTYELGNTSFYVVTSQAAAVLNGLQGMLEADKQVIVSRHQPGQVLMAEGLRQEPNRVKMSLGSLVQSKILTACRQANNGNEVHTIPKIGLYAVNIGKDDSITEYLF